jgi:Protein of unknown function (DUF4235)
MSKILFLPFGLAGGLIAGVLGKITFERIWSLVDDQEAPDPKHRQADWRKLLPALALEGAVFRLVRGAFDHGARKLFSTLTGSWPGEERPEPA